MDHSSIPECALYRNTGTVIVRIKMEVSTSCCKREVCPASCCPVVHTRPSGCEQCTRTRLINQYSDCDSGVVEKSRPYRSSTARSRYVNVCAAVCLLLLVGSLSPRSCAAPHRSRGSMERSRRALEEENELWANPCDYADFKNPAVKPNKVRGAALKIGAIAKNALISAYRYNESFVKMHSFQRFADLVANWESDEWLRKTNPDALPKEKVLSESMSLTFIGGIIDKMDAHLPALYSGLKMIVASLYKFTQEGLNDDIVADEALKANINKTMYDVREVLCYMNSYMTERHLQIRPLLNKDVPNFKNDRSYGFLLYRDTLTYLEYLVQVFAELAEKESGHGI